MDTCIMHYQNIHNTAVKSVYNLFNNLDTNPSCNIFLKLTQQMTLYCQRILKPKHL